MGKKDPRVDAYIARSADFARPILTRLRKLVHEGCPEVVEDIKWGMPHFMYDGMFCGMASFKSHCAFGFWNRALKIGGSRNAMGQFGRIASISDLPKDEVLLGYVRQAKALADAGTKVGPLRRDKKALSVPKDLLTALKKKPKALAHFDKFSPSAKRDYSEWLIEAKTDTTRAKRLATAVEWIGEGKPRNWKYMPAKKA
jgi:uncharacterized protein YdeI (YjbR/CyaY-like superfamily)